MNRMYTYLAAALLACFSCTNKPDIDIPDVNNWKPDEDTLFYTGTSMTFASYLEDVGGQVYRENGVATDPYRSVKAGGGNIIRLSLEPEGFVRTPGMDASGAPDIDWQLLPRVKQDMLKAKNAGLDVVLTLKPEKTVCRMWEYITDRTALGDVLYDWCYSVLDELALQNTFPAIVAIGNEINAAFMSPADDYANNIYDYERNVYFVNRGIAAVRAIEKKYNKKILVAVHIFSPSNVEWWLNQHYTKGLTDFDILALSYYLNYPGHSMGNWVSFGHLGQWLKTYYKKRFMILETSYPYTMANADSQTNVYNAGLYESGGTTSPAQQRDFFRDMAKAVRDGGGLGMITWGSESLPTQAYIYANDTWGKGSSWDNNSYWDAQCNLHEGIRWMGDL